MGRGRPGATRDAAVQSTGDSSAVSKCSAAARGYVRDRFLGLLVGRRRRRRAPLIHRGYYIRTRAVDHCVQDFLLKTQSHSRTQILSLGAGFDSLYFRLKDMGLLSHTVVYEVDFPNVACQKATLIKGIKELSALVGDAGGEGLGAITFSGEDYKLLGVDLSELSKLEKALEKAGLDNEVPTLFLAEVVLTYMENSRSDALIQWAAEHFPQACFVLYEQMHPEDPFGRVMQQHFSQLNSTLHSLAQYPDREAQRRRFLQREWHLKCSHYFVLTAAKGMKPSWTPLLSHMAVPCGDGPVRMAGSVTASVCGMHSEAAGLRRYGHHSALIKPNVILTTGGFGEEDGQHCRMRNFHVLIKHEGCWKAGCVKKENCGKRWDGRLYHTVSCLSNSLALMVGGRTSPSSAALGMLWLKFPESCDALDSDGITVELVDLQPVAESAALRWRHSATEVTFRGEKYLFIYGGRSAMQPVLGDWYFLHTEELSCTVIPVEGPVPEGRHSHSACSWRGGVLIAGGLGAAEQPLGSVFFLREIEHGFQWQTVETHPPLIPRYSHTAHVHDEKLLLVGGVWFHSSSVPGLTVIDLMTGLCMDCMISVEHLEWPLMLHNHSSVFLPNEKELLLIGGGGNCFSFGTHLNPEPVSLSLSNILTSH
uniref:tRNA wybutosine-synthesizing protein 4 n=1 Tax=Apteryx owenii TaxID=8824 RepID=A0A8B9QGU6_APTOW